MTMTKYDPMSTFLPDRRIGRLVVRGNDDLAKVYHQGWAYGVCQPIVRIEDNRDGPPAGQPASAFERALRWASKQEEVPCSSTASGT